MPSLKLLFAAFLILIVNVTVTWQLNRPVDAGPDVPTGKLRSLSFAPYHAGFSPITETFPLPEHVHSDVRILADKTFSIRTYSVRGGMQPTPEFARQYGVDVMMGAWLGNGEADNKLEIQTLIQAAQQNSDVVKRVIVGNEVLLRKDMDIDKLIAYIRQVKQAVTQPVTYADVWSSYMQYPQLFNEVDFITVHILPYWEDEPVSIDMAAQHVEKIVKQIKDKARTMGVEKPLLIGESGWPAIGRQRGAAVPSVVNEARFIRELIQVANKQGFDYNIVEAFNQPWKSHNEGVVGANWGLLDIDRKPVFPLVGPVQENPDWQTNFAWGLGLWLLVIALGFKALQKLALPKQLLFLAFGQLFSICIVHLADFLWHTSYSPWQQGYSLFLTLANTVLAALLLQRFLALLNKPINPQAQSRLLKNTYLFFLLLAVYKGYHLAIDGRYLSFPTEQFAIPALGILGGILCLAISRKTLTLQSCSFEHLTGWNAQQPYLHYLGYALGLSTLAIIIGETYSFMSAYDFIQAHPDFVESAPVALGYSLQNGQLLTWLLYSLILAAPFCIKPGAQQPPAA